MMHLSYIVLMLIEIRSHSFHLHIYQLFITYINSNSLLIMAKNVKMAKKQICIEANEKMPSITKIAAVHILGDCPVSKASVILCASSPHRKDAIHCVEFLIDELKARVPIWKLESYQDGEGESVWKENAEWFNGKQRRVMVKVPSQPPKQSVGTEMEGDVGKRC